MKHKVVVPEKESMADFFNRTQLTPVAGRAAVERHNEALVGLFNDFKPLVDHLFMGREAALAMGLDVSNQPPGTCIMLSKDGVTYIEIEDE